VKVKARMAGEPRFDLGMLVSRVIVGDQMQLEGYRDVSIEMFQKEFLVAMARLALGDAPPSTRSSAANSVAVPRR
jgi:hypothetical protein